MSEDDIGGGLTYIETRNKIAAIREAKLAEVIAERDKLRERCDAYKGQVEAGASEIARLTAQVERQNATLKEISEGKGRFSTDQFQHAKNTIEDMKELARQALSEAELWLLGFQISRPGEAVREQFLKAFSSDDTP